MNFRTNELAFNLKLEVDQEFMQLLERVKLLVPGYQGSMKEVLQKVLSDYEKRNCPKQKQIRRQLRKKSSTKKTIPVKKPSSARTAIPQANQDEIRLRDGRQCTYVSPEGFRCSCRSNLEIDHVVPVAKGGNNDISNLRLLCRAHNLLMAEKEFGSEFVRKFSG